MCIDKICNGCPLLKERTCFHLFNKLQMITKVMLSGMNGTNYGFCAFWFWFRLFFVFFVIFWFRFPNAQSHQFISGCVHSHTCLSSTSSPKTIYWIRHLQPKHYRQSLFLSIPIENAPEKEKKKLWKYSNIILLIIFCIAWVLDGQQ